jgi:hypothetical protein
VQPVVPTTPETPVTPPTPETPVTPATPVAATPAVPETPVAPPTAPVTPPPTPPAVLSGRLSVTSDPSGARVFVNGENTGRTTPTTVENLSPGKRVNVAVMHKGYEDWRRTVTVEGDKTVPVYASLKKEPSATPPPPKETKPKETPPKEKPKEETAKKPEEKPKQPPPPPPPPVRPPVEEKPVATAGKPGSLAVTSDPSGADVYVNSEYKGKTPLRVNDVSPGTVKVAVSKDGYMKQTQTVKIGPGENKSTGTIKLGGMFGEIYVNSSPPRATVIFDGTITSKTPVTIRKVPRDQKHTIRIKLDGYRDWETSVSLSDKDSKRFEVQLEKN